MSKEFTIFDATTLEEIDHSDEETGKLTTRTENGGDAYTASGVGDDLVTLFFAMVRRMPRKKMRKMLRKVVTCGDKMALVDLVVMTVHCRDVRNGKGERTLFTNMILEFLQVEALAPVTVSLVPMIASFGSFRDLKELLVAIDEETTKLPVGADAVSAINALRDALLDTFAKQLRADLVALKRDDCATITLAAKWAPRECQKRYKRVAKLLALWMFPNPDMMRKHFLVPLDKCTTKHDADGPSIMTVEEMLASATRYAKTKYRMLVADLNRALKTPEVLMCEGEWADLVPSALPAACLRTKRRALLNKPRIRSRGGPNPLNASADARSDEPDRIQCAAQLTTHLARGGNVHGCTINVHSLVNDAMKSDTPEIVTEAQWVDVRAQFEEMATDPEKPCKLGRYVALSDVSGSMTGDPMAVAIGLGILISEVCHPTFRDRFMTFESVPRWHSLAGEPSFHAKVKSAVRAPWGGSTNFVAAMNLLLETCVAAQLSHDEVPEALVVISDMQFDQARNDDYAFGGRGDDTPTATDSWASDATQIDTMWRSAGYPKAPTIVFWNCRHSYTNSFPATATTPGVEMVSGFSQNLLKLFMEGSDDCIVPTPHATMRRALDAANYDDVRAIALTILSTHEDGPETPEGGGAAAAAVVD